jgi:O-antigen ligase
VAVATPEMRIHIWTRTLVMIRDAPVLGVGLGNFREVFESKYNPEVGGDGTRGVHAHNLWLQQFAELGVAGGIAYAVLWFHVAWIGWRQVRRRPGFVPLAPLLSLTALAVSNLTTNMFYLTGGASGRLQSLTWVLFGLVAGSASLTDRVPDASGAR